MYESGKPKVGYMQVTRLGGATILSTWSPHLSCKRDQIKMRLYGQVGTPHKKVISPTWGPPPQCQQALTNLRQAMQRIYQAILISDVQLFILSTVR